MKETELILFVIRALVQYGIPALEKIVELIKKYDGAQQVPEEDWRTLFERIKALDYWDYVGKK